MQERRNVFKTNCEYLSVAMTPLQSYPYPNDKRHVVYVLDESSNVTLKIRWEKNWSASEGAFRVEFRESAPFLRESAWLKHCLKARGSRQKKGRKSPGPGNIFAVRVRFPAVSTFARVYSRERRVSYSILSLSLSLSLFLSLAELLRAVLPIEINFGWISFSWKVTKRS